MPDDSRDKIAAARVWLMRHKPFFGVLARAFRLEATTRVAGFRLLADDRLLFNPDAVLGLRFAALCARLAHLSLHAALTAFARRREREPLRWNVACDLAIAPLLDAAQLSVGAAPRALANELPMGASAEAYYPLLPDGVMPEPLWCDLCDPPNQGESLGAAALPAPWSLDEPSSSESGDHALQWKLRLAAAYEEELAQGGPTFGELPGWLDDMVRATIEPPADWSALLQQSLHQLQRTDRSYLRPSRRTSALIEADGSWPALVTMPGHRIAHAGRLVVVVDTSASLPLGTLARFFGAIVATATAEGIDELRLIQADASITKDEVVFTADLLWRDIVVTGRGGSDFAPPLVSLAAQAASDCERYTVIYLTDLDGHLPQADTVAALEVLWVVCGKARIVPPFGRVLLMSGHAER